MPACQATSRQGSGLCASDESLFDTRLVPFFDGMLIGAVRVAIMVLFEIENRPARYFGVFSELRWPAPATPKPVTSS